MKYLKHYEKYGEENCSDIFWYQLNYRLTIII